MTERVANGVAFQTYVILRCARWGTYVRWVSHGGTADPRPRRVASWWGPIVLDGNVEQIGIESVRDVCPVDVEEAEETRRCVDALPSHLRRTIIEEYVICGAQELKARSMDVDVRTFRRRRDYAHTLLLGLFNDAAAGLPLEPTLKVVGRPKA